MDDQTGRSYGELVEDVRPRTRRRWAPALLLLVLLVVLAAGAWYGW